MAETSKTKSNSKQKIAKNNTQEEKIVRKKLGKLSILVLVLVFVLSFTMVACKPKTKDILLTENMTTEELLAAVKDFENFIIEEIEYGYDGEELLSKKIYRHYISDNIFIVYMMSEKYENGETITEHESYGGIIVEGDRYYDTTYEFITEETDAYVTFDALANLDESDSPSKWLSYMKENIKRIINGENGEVTIQIKDGNIIITLPDEVEEGNTYKVAVNVRDINKTSLDSIPEIANYKEIATQKEADEN